MLLNTAKAVIDSKFGDAPPRPAGPRLRIGQVLGADPTPFILATGSKVRPPEGSETSVKRIGRVSQPVPLTRLYVADDAFYQIHQAADGSVDECRYFALFDQVEPADADEWGFWLSDEDGMVGFPVFQTKDGAEYRRLWKPGDARVRPVEQVEGIETLSAPATARREAMLYARTLPGTEVTEYLLVAVERDATGAYVGLWAGLDVSPAALGL